MKDKTTNYTGMMLNWVLTKFSVLLIGLFVLIEITLVTI
jgi:hypothetical protein